MSVTRSTRFGGIFVDATILCGMGAALAQNAPISHGMKTIGTSTAAAAAPYAYPVARPACGYYPYPPCY